MTPAGAWEMIKTAFEVSPYLAAVVALILWLGFCWKFRLVSIGRRRSLPNMLLATFTVPIEEVNLVTDLVALKAVTVKAKTPATPGYPTASILGSAASGNPGNPTGRAAGNPAKNYPESPTEATTSSDDGRADWKLGEVYQVYWTLIARGQVVRYTTVLVAFSALSLLVMYLAQPAESVSLMNVANVIGAGAFLPLAVLGLLSLAMVLLSAHQLPCKAISTEKPRTIMLFSW